MTTCLPAATSARTRSSTKFLGTSSARGVDSGELRGARPRRRRGRADKPPPRERAGRGGEAALAYDTRVTARARDAPAHGLASRVARAVLGASAPCFTARGGTRCSRPAARCPSSSRRSSRRAAHRPSTTPPRRQAAATPAALRRRGPRVTTATEAACTATAAAGPTRAAPPRSAPRRPRAAHARRAAGRRRARATCACLTTWRRAPAIRRPFRGQAARAGRPRATISISSGAARARSRRARTTATRPRRRRATQRRSSAFDPPALINTLAARSSTPTPSGSTRRALIRSSARSRSVPSTSAPARSRRTPCRARRSSPASTRRAQRSGRARSRTPSPRTGGSSARRSLPTARSPS